MTVTGAFALNYKIVEKKAYSVFSKSIEVTNNASECFSSIPHFWKECIENGTMNDILAIAGNKGPIMFSDDVYGSDSMLINAVMYGHDNKSFQYMVSQICPKECIDFGGYNVIEIPAQKWAVFSTSIYSQSEITQEIQKLWKRIGNEWWIQAVDYEHAYAPELEIYHHIAGKFQCELWVPIIKKERGLL